ncbi:helix-turn-helix transcriptional regulator [[Mycobacterium] holstebronense]|nr:helix-turn-helix transcriptional regulator [Mycolicibacter sp. MU0102]
MTRMIAGLTAERVRGDIDVLSRAGLDLDHFVQEAVGAVGRAVPWVGACVGTHDPASLMLTSARKYGALTPNRDDDLLFGQLEYGFGEFTSFRSLVHHDIRAVSMLQLPKDVVDGSPRTHQLIRPVYGFTDEARLLMRDDTGMWGCLALFRDDGAPFAEDDLTFLESLSAAFARGVRSGILTRLGAAETEAPSARGPAVVVVNAAGEIAQISRGATQVLEELATLGDAGAPYGIIAGMASAARAMATDSEVPLPTARLRMPSGHWQVLHASPMDGPDGATGDVVVTIEEARPPEIVALVVAAFGLTPREREVTRMVLQGCDTKAIAVALHVSAYTVQDHLKSVFAKAGVRSRRDLIARVYFDQYVPRMGAAVGPAGFFM